MSQRILVAEDEPNIRQYVQDILEGTPDVELTLVPDGEEASRRLGEGGWDLVISDQRMGQKDGLHVLAEAAQRDPQAARMMMTGYAELHLVEAATNLGHVQRFLAKPFSPDQLREAVADLLARVRHEKMRGRAFSRALSLGEAKATEK